MPSGLRHRTFNPVLVGSNPSAPTTTRGCGGRKRLPHQSRELLDAAAVDFPVQLGVAQDGLYIVVCLGERDGLDELRRLPPFAPGPPAHGARLAGVVGRQRLLPVAVEVARRALADLRS